MSQPQPYRLEVTRALLNRARAARFCFGEDTAIIAVQHMLRQTVDLCRIISEMGARLKNIFALGKVYSNSPPVIGSLRNMGVTVIETTNPEPGKFYSYFQNDIDELWQTVVTRLAQRRIKRVLILDDGGACITSVPADVQRQYILSAVEQTSSGMFLFEEKPPPFAVITWARAAVKLEIGGPIFAHSFVDKINTNFLDGRPLRGEQIGIIGLGSIGRGVAHLVARQGSEVRFYDPNPDVQVPSSLQGRITRMGSLEELMRACDYVFGCSGRNPFAGKWPMKHRPGVKLFSASGGDQEFGPIIRDLKSKQGFKVRPNTWDIVSDGPSGPLRIAYLGYPYNFVSRQPEAVPGRIVQLETGGLLASLMQARLHLDLVEKGKRVNRGIYRVSPRAQRFVYERWLREMKNANIHLTAFGHDSKTLASAQRDGWLAEHTQPLTPPDTVEEMMMRIINAPNHSRPEGETKPNLRTFRQF